MSDREQILRSLPPSGSSELPPVFNFPLLKGDEEALFIKRFQELGGKFLSWGELCEMSKYGTWSVEPSSTLELNLVESSPWDADFGIVEATFGIAELGSIFLVHDESSRRLASLAPPKTVFVLKRSKIVPTLAEALGFLNNQNAVIIAGPSRTADIEGVLVNGVHGPKEIFAVLVD